MGIIRVSSKIRIKSYLCYIVDIVTKKIDSAFKTIIIFDKVCNNFIVSNKYELEKQDPRGQGSPCYFLSRFFKADGFLWQLIHHSGLHAFQARR
jgi:hypothetical protein